jgi:hypothetical protein
MLIIRRIPATILVITSLVLPARTAPAHPSSGIVVDQKGQVFFQDIVARAIWRIDAQGNLTKYYDRLGGHWMALDGDGRFARADLKLVKRITPSGAKPTLLVADGGAPIVVHPEKIAPDGKVESVLRAERPWSPTGVAVRDGAVYVLEYTNANGGPGEGWLPRVRRLGRDGRVTTLATISRR